MAGVSYNGVPIEQRLWDRVEKTATCWLWTGGKQSDGYGTIFYNGHREKVHRVAWMLTFGAVLDELCVLHRCDVRHCVRPDHLFLGTYRDNVHDMIQKGRSPVIGRRGSQTTAQLARVRRGEQKQNAKLTWVKVEEIRERIARGESRRGIAPEYGVRYQTIQAIVNGKTWTCRGRR